MKYICNIYKFHVRSTIDYINLRRICWMYWIGNRPIFWMRYIFTLTFCFIFFDHLLPRNLPWASHLLYYSTIFSLSLYRILTLLFSFGFIVLNTFYVITIIFGFIQYSQTDVDSDRSHFIRISIDVKLVIHFNGFLLLLFRIPSSGCAVITLRIRILIDSFLFSQHLYSKFPKTFIPKLVIYPVLLQSVKFNIEQDWLPAK